jgi:hypothetical protein
MDEGIGFGMDARLGRHLNLARRLGLEHLLQNCDDLCHCHAYGCHISASQVQHTV